MWLLSQNLFVDLHQVNCAKNLSKGYGKHKAYKQALNSPYWIMLCFSMLQFFFSKTALVLGSIIKKN